MTSVPRVLYTELAEDEATALLARNNVGRLAYSFHDRVDIEPISYAYDNGWLYGRTSEGAKYLTVRHNPWVALQVDEVRSEQDWASVVAHGGFHVLEREGAGGGAEAFRLALSVLSTADLRNQLARVKQQVADAIAREQLFKNGADALMRSEEDKKHAEALDSTWQIHRAETQKLKQELREINDRISDAGRKRNLPAEGGPAASTAPDVAPHRNVVFRIRVSEITGRKAAPAPVSESVL